MAYPTPTFEQTRDLYLQSVRNNGQPDAPIGPDSDNYVRACALAAVVEGVYAHQAWVFRQAFPDLADADVMERMANQKGLTRKPAAAAGGTVRITGTVSAAVAIGTQVFTSQGTRYQTQAAAVVDVTGYVDVVCAALVAGVAGNLVDNTPVTVDAPPAGVQAAATALTMTSGADTESDSALRARLLLRLVSPPQGGAVADYQQWALEVPGVARAYVYPLRRGRGTVDVVPIPVTGLPSGALVTAVQTSIDAVRPTGLGATGFQALAPTAVPVAVKMALTYAAGVSPAAVQADVDAALDVLFAALAPGATLIQTRLIATIMSITGVTDVAVSAPAGNTASTVDANNLQLLTKGAVTFL